MIVILLKLLVACLLCDNKVTSHSWHHRLGHLSFKRLEFLKDQLHFKGEKNGITPYYICPLAKQRRLAFISNNHLSSYSFDLIHCDVWGPYSFPTRDDHKFFLTFVDDCT